MVLRAGIIVAALLTLVSCGRREGGMWIVEDRPSSARSVERAPRKGKTTEVPTPSLPAKAVSLPDDYVPRYAVEEAEQFRREFLRENSRSASALDWRFFYDASGTAYVEYTVTPKDGWTWEEQTWLGYEWGGRDGEAGDTKYTKTQKQLDEADYRMEERRKDRAFREIERVVLGIANEYDYDFYDAYAIKVKYRDPNVKKTACVGYSEEVAARLKNNPFVKNVELWTGSLHEWSVVVLKDGRRLYCDATWYDGNKIDDEGYVVHIPSRDPCALTFDKKEFDSMGGAVNRSTGRLLAVHFAGSDVRQEL